MLSVAIILAIALAIFLGYKTKINTGLFCIVFAYIIGCFVMGLKPKQVIGYWPTSTMFRTCSVAGSAIRSPSPYKGVAPDSPTRFKRETQSNQTVGTLPIV